MKVFMLITSSGPLVILTSFESILTPALLDKLAGKGITKFLAYEVPRNLAEQRYGGHFAVVMQDLHESDDLRVLDYSGERAFRLFRFDELGAMTVYEPPAEQVRAA